MTTLAIVGCGPSVPIDPAAETSTTRADDDDGDDDPSPTSATPTTSPSTAGEATGSPTTSTSGSTETSTSEVESSSDSSDEHGPSFIQIPDTSCFTSCAVECDLWAQDCAEGEKCMPGDLQGAMQWNEVLCTPVARMPGIPGDPCVAQGSQWSGIDDCELGAMCWNVDETNTGTCAGFCLGSQANPSCDVGVCFEAYPFLGVYLVMLCLPSCEPLTPACDPGLACVESYSEPLPDTFACVPESLVADRSQYADPCDETIGCGTGLLCTVAADVPACESDCCTTLCDPLAANTCPDAAAGQVCIAHAATPSLGHCGFP